jgi:hypothetical protein
MNMKLIAVVAAGLLPSYAGAGPIDLTQDLGGLDVTVTLAPRDSPEAMRLDNKSLKTISCSAHFTGADQNRTVKVTVKPGKSGTIRIPPNRGGMPRTAELRCRERAPDPK